MSAVTPPSQDDDDEWQSPDNGGGHWEDEEPRKSRSNTTRRVRPRRASRLSGLTNFWREPKGRLLIIIGLAALIGMCVLACVALVLFAVSFGRGASLFPQPTPTPIPSPTVPLAFQLQNVVQVNRTPISPAIPDRMDISGKSFVVHALHVDGEGAWQYDINDRRAAWWAVGSMVNYVVGLYNNTDNRALYDSLNPGDLISLNTSAGLQRYRVTEKVSLPAEDMSTLADQSKPRMTLIMLGQSGVSRDALIADYTDEGTPGEAVAWGAPVNLGDVRVLATDAGIIPGKDIGLLEGRNYYQVNLEVTNLVTEMVDTAQFTVDLVDGQGNRYAISPPGAIASGGFGWNKGVVKQGETLTLTSAFEVPAGMVGPMLEWSFRTLPDSPYVARVMIPYEAEAQPTSTPAPTSQPRLRIDVANANISPDGAEINVIGNLTDLTGRTLSISLQDVSLTGADGARAALNSSLPQVPWEVNAGSTLTFKLSFAMPVQLPATLSVLDQAIVIGGN
ncbi:MAG: hypothetical protein NTZ50_04320 [Chloroflexi bacterium]|nr:hypothetical protein [Chloroflexota bacterium]